MSVWNRLVESGLTDQERRSGALLEAPSTPSNDRPNQFVVLLKPELLESQVDVPAVVDLVIDRFEAEDAVLGGIRWFTGDELRESRVMERHYGVINEVSRRGLEALSEAQLERFSAIYGETPAAPVRGAHAFLAEHPELTSSDLRGAFSGAEVHKIAPGIYAASTTVAGTPVVLLNGFHPAQLDHFTSTETRMVALEYRSSQPWTYLRKDLAGATDPTVAAETSLRRQLLEERDRFGLEMSVNSNGVHLSAGPLEGCAEVIRFFSTADHEVAVASTVLGSALIEAGASDELIAAALDNTLVISGESVFDATEELDLDDAVRVLIGAPTP